MKPIHFSVPGEPIGKGRPRFSSQGGRPRTYTPPRTAEYESRIAQAFRAAGGEIAPRIPLMVAIRVIKGIPNSAPRHIKAMMRDGYIVPDTRPDLDNVIKAVLDGLNGLAWHDDSQATAIVAKQEYADIPGLRVTISAIPRKQFRERR